MTTAEKSLFKDGHAALMFAFNISGQRFDRPLMNRLAAPMISRGEGISGLDAVGQAGMIRKQVEGLGKLQEAILVARTAPHAIDCQCNASCCSGNRPNKEWVDAVSWLSEYIRTTALAGCMSNGIMRREYIVRYFAHKKDRKTIESMARHYQVDRNTISAHAGRVNLLFGGRPARVKKDDYAPAVPGLESVALNALEELLRSLELVG